MGGGRITTEAGIEKLPVERLTDPPAVGAAIVNAYCVLKVAV